MHAERRGSDEMAADTSVTRLVRVTNRYSVPSRYASQRLTLKVFLDRLCLYHAETVVIGGSSFRMKDRIET